MVGVAVGASCKALFKTNKMLTVPSIYIKEVLLFVHSNKSLFKRNTDFHNMVPEPNFNIQYLHITPVFTKGIQPT